MAVFAFKSHLKDFLVDEQLPYVLANKGEYFLVQIEKQNTTTMEIVDHLTKYLKVPKSAIGYAGLKDKYAITKQRFSFHMDQIIKRFPDKKHDKLIIAALLKVCRVLTTGRSDKALTTKDDFINHFTIILRARKLHEKERPHIESVLGSLFSNPIPNFFGEQRFGIDGQNVQQALDILEWVDKTITGFDRMFKLQAYASYLFNQMLEKRISRWPKLIDGDLIVHDKKTYLHEEGRLYEQQDWHKKQIFFVQAKSEGKSIQCDPKVQYDIALPVLGYNSLIAAQDTDFGEFLHKFMTNNQISPSKWKLYKDLQIFGINRSVWIQPVKPSWERDGDDIIMEFSLPAGSYASVVVDQFLNAIESWKTTTNWKNWKWEEIVWKASVKRLRKWEKLPIDRSLPQNKQEKKAKSHRKGKPKPKTELTWKQQTQHATKAWKK